MLNPKEFDYGPPPPEPISKRHPLPPHPHLRLMPDPEPEPEKILKPKLPVLVVRGETVMSALGGESRAIKSRWIETVDGQKITGDDEIKEFLNHRRGPNVRNFPEERIVYRPDRRGNLVPENRFREGLANMGDWFRYYGKKGFWGSALGLLLIGGGSQIYLHRDQIWALVHPENKQQTAPAASPSITPKPSPAESPRPSQPAIPICPAGSKCFIDFNGVRQEIPSTETNVFQNPDPVIGDPKVWGDPNESSLPGEAMDVVYVYRYLNGDQQKFQPNLGYGEPDNSFNRQRQYAMMQDFNDKFYGPDAKSNMQVVKALLLYWKQNIPQSSLDPLRSDLFKHGNNLPLPENMPAFISKFG